MATGKALRLILAASAASLAVTPALADDLREALTSAYSTNPTLQAARATQRATVCANPAERQSAISASSDAARACSKSARGT